MQDFNLSEWNEVDTLGQGTYGVVKKLKHIQMDTFLAKKTVKSEGLDYDVVREIAIYSLFKATNSPNSAKCKYLKMSDGEIVFGLELATTTLAKYLSDMNERIQALPDITERCILSLNNLHCFGIIHADVKPENILIWLRKDHSIKKLALCDFGLSTSRPDPRIYTSPYRPPEILKNFSLFQTEYVATRHSDVWAMGATLLTWLVGYMLFHVDVDSDDDDFEDMMNLRTSIDENALGILAKTSCYSKIINMLEVDPLKRLLPEIKPVHLKRVSGNIPLAKQKWLKELGKEVGQESCDHAIDIASRFWWDMKGEDWDKLDLSLVAALMLAAAWATDYESWSDIKTPFTHKEIYDMQKLMIYEMGGLIYLP
jgi:serine/threonine protein kinase